MAVEELADRSENGLPKWRSPPVPVFGLRRAVERAAELDSKVGHHKVPVHVALDQWNYSAKSSGGIQAIATLIQFGLLQDEGSGLGRRVWLTADATRIIKDKNPASEPRKQAFSRVFLAPRIYQELFDRFGLECPADGVLISYLTLDRRDEGKAPFSERAAVDAIKAYRETLEYVAELGVISDGVPKAEHTEQDAIVQAVVAVEAGPSPVRRDSAPSIMPVQSPSQPRSGLMDGERELQTGMLSKTASYRVVVNGKVGVREIERLIKKLEMDKEILADEEDPRDPDLMFEADRERRLLER